MPRDLTPDEWKPIEYALKQASGSMEMVALSVSVRNAFGSERHLLAALTALKSALSCVRVYRDGGS